MAAPLLASPSPSGELMRALAGKDIDKVSQSLQADPSMLEKKLDNQGTTPLGLACVLGKMDAVKLLLARGANPNNLSGKSTPLVLAIYRNRPDIVQVLLAAKADPNVLDAKGTPALMSAVALSKLYGDETAAKMCDLLLSAGAKRDAQVSPKNTALAMARALNAPKTLEVLQRSR